MADALRFDRVSKVYETFASGSRHALRDVTFTMPAGRVVAVVGRSGSGKSTLLHLAAGIDVPTAGEVLLQGRALGTLSDGARTLLRRDAVGLVFQFFHLLPHLTLRDNVVLPALIAGVRPAACEPRALELLERVGLADRAGDPVQKLSGGEMQRVAICRALLRRPAVLLADEPTGNLDDDNGRRVMDLLLALAREEGRSLLYVTHRAEELPRCLTHVLRLRSGRVVGG